mgnify:CR=1 FL=1
MKTNRLDWDISQGNKWVALYKPTNKYLFALTKSLLMSEINKFEKTL